MKVSKYQISKEDKAKSGLEIPLRLAIVLKIRVFVFKATYTYKVRDE